MTAEERSRAARVDLETQAAFDALAVAQSTPDANGSFDALHSLPGTEVEWPTLDAAALHGPAGTIVEKLLPETEADPVALLFTILAASGAAMGRNSYAAVGGAQHPARLFVVLVGRDLGGPQGDEFSWAEVRRVLAAADRGFVDLHILGGFRLGRGADRRRRRE